MYGAAIYFYSKTAAYVIEKLSLCGVRRNYTHIPRLFDCTIFCELTYEITKSRARGQG